VLSTRLISREERDFEAFDAGDKNLLPRSTDG
jgi:hypothetical protein